MDKKKNNEITNNTHGQSLGVRLTINVKLRRRKK